MQLPGSLKNHASNWPWNHLLSLVSCEMRSFCLWLSFIFMLYRVKLFWSSAEARHRARQHWQFLLHLSVRRMRNLHQEMVDHYGGWRLLLQEGCSICKQTSKPFLIYKSVYYFIQNSHLSYSNMIKFALYHTLLVDYCETMIILTNTAKYSLHHFHGLNDILCNISGFFHSMWNNPSCLIVQSQY